jgi:hypothetical protein
MESPESWFEDFGRAELTEGSAEVELDGDFAALVNTDDYHVFLTPEGDSAGLYVSARSRQAFEVREQGNGTGTVEFSYRSSPNARTSRRSACRPLSLPRDDGKPLTSTRPNLRRAPAFSVGPPA